MLLSLAIIFLGGFFFSKLFSKLKFPPLIGMIFLGIFLGPFAFDFIVIDESILNISVELRKIALIIILFRAGLSLKFDDLKKNGVSGVLMCFLPATLEIIGAVIFAPIFFDVEIIDAFIIGTVLAAVSPAVIVPLMIKLKDLGYGKNKKIPELILASSSIDDVFVLVLFAFATGIKVQNEYSFVSIINIPFSILLGASLGFLIGIIFLKYFSEISDAFKIIVLLSIAFLLVVFEEYNFCGFSFSGLIAVLFLGMTINYKSEQISQILAAEFSKLWSAFEILLFVLVGATVNLSIIKDFLLLGIILIFCALFFRIIGVFLSLKKTDFNFKEKLFCSISYIPKATVQAAIGGVPLSLGIESGNLILAIAVLAILITAPLGSFLITKLYKKLL